MRTERNQSTNNDNNHLTNDHNSNDERFPINFRETNNHDLTNNLENRSKNFKKHGQQNTLNNGQKINQIGQKFRKSSVSEEENIENEKNKDEEIIINFTQFFHLLLQISKVVYSEIYHGPGSLTQYVTHRTDSTTHFISGPSVALEKVIRVSQFA